MRSPRRLEALVEEHVRRWEIAQRAARPPGRRPCVSLSRLPGSGAADLGQQVADRLRVHFYGIEIVDHIAREADVQRQLVAALDEQVRRTLERYVLDALRPFNEDDYLKQVVRTLNVLADQGGVFLGRGAVFILPPERALRVLVTAPEEHRIERTAKAHDLDTAEARARLAREEVARLEFHRHHFGLDPNDPTLYDLMVNLGTLPLEASVGLVVQAVSERFAVEGDTPASR